MVHSVTLSTGYHLSRRGLMSLSTGYISRPMVTTTRPAQIIRSTPTVNRARSVSPSTNAWTRDVPNMAVTIWTTNRMPTAVAILLLGIGSKVRDVGALVAMRVVMACLSDDVERVT